MSFVSTPKEVKFQNVLILAIVGFCLLYCSVGLFDILKTQNSAEHFTFFFQFFFPRSTVSLETYFWSCCFLSKVTFSLHSALILGACSGPVRDQMVFWCWAVNLFSQGKNIPLRLRESPCIHHGAGGIEGLSV